MKKTSAIKNLIVIITILSLLSGVIDKIFPNFFQLPNLIKLLSLQIDSFSSFKIWQFVTHMFFYPAGHGIHIFYLINLLFGMMILNRVGTAIEATKGTLAFIKFFLFCGVVSGLAAFCTISHFSIPAYYASPSNAIYCLMLSLVFLFPHMDLMIFFSSPVKGKTLIPALISLLLLMSLSTGDYVNFFSLGTSAIFSYLYIVFFWNLKSPYPFMQKFESSLIALSQGKFKSMLKFVQLDKYAKSNTIVDFKTGKAIMSEENFINACLDKIAQEGKSSLTYYERYRLYRHGLKNRRNKNAAKSYQDTRDR